MWCCRLHGRSHVVGFVVKRLVGRGCRSGCRVLLTSCLWSEMWVILLWLGLIVRAASRRCICCELAGVKYRSVFHFWSDGRAVTIVLMIEGSRRLREMLIAYRRWST
jgi:hypothetical protein